MFKSKYVASALASAAVVAFSAAPAYAYVQPIYLEVNQSYYMPQNSAIKRIAVTNQKIADVKVLNKHAINIVALGPGSTSLTVWNVNGMRQEFVISVTQSDSNLANLIQKAIGLPHVKVEKVGSKILLSGKVVNQREKDRAIKIASLYLDSTVTKEHTSNVGNTSTSSDDDTNLDLPNDDGELVNENIVDLLELENPDQINIEAQVVEISTDDAKELGVEYSGDSNVSSPGTYYAAEGSVTRDKGSHWYSRNWLFTHFSNINTKIHYLVTNGKARIISRPNITTMSGKNAGILIGGQIPYPKADSNGSTDVDFKSYGIQLKLLKPEVDREGNITAKLFAGVSRLDWANAVTANGYNMPGLATRSAETMVNVPSGMTMAIGGLMNSDDADTISSVPLLGKIPVLGNLFKYHNKTKQKTEILILITPRVVNETTPVKMTPEMKDAHIDVRNEDQAMYRINLNESVEDIMKDAEKQDVARVQTASSKKKAEKQAQEKAKKQEKQKLSEKKDSILGKYLDQDVLQPAEKAN